MARFRETPSRDSPDAAHLVHPHLLRDRRALVRFDRAAKSRVPEFLFHPRASPTVCQLERARMGSVVFHSNSYGWNLALDFLRAAWMVLDAPRQRLRERWSASGNEPAPLRRELSRHLVHRDFRFLFYSTLEARDLHSTRAPTARDFRRIRTFPAKLDRGNVATPPPRRFRDRQPDFRPQWSRVFRGCAASNKSDAGSRRTPCESHHWRRRNPHLRARS